MLAEGCPLVAWLGVVIGVARGCVRAFTCVQDGVAWFTTCRCRARIQPRPASLPVRLEDRVDERLGSGNVRAEVEVVADAVAVIRSAELTSRIHAIEEVLACHVRACSKPWEARGGPR